MSDDKKSPLEFDSHTGLYRRGVYRNGAFVPDEPYDFHMPKIGPQYLRLLYGSSVTLPGVLWGSDNGNFWHAKKYKRPHHEIIEVIFSSIGGGTSERERMINLRRHFPSKSMRTVCFPLAASIASTGYLLGDFREIHKDGWIMVHNPHATDHGMRTWGPERSKVEIEKVRQEMLDFYHRVLPHIPRRKWEEWCHAETWFSADDAIRWGLAHRVLDDRWVINWPTESHRKCAGGEGQNRP